jgi:FtsH-binding integral membrane protein
MIDAEERPLLSPATPAAASEVDLGLRSFLLGVLSKVALGLLVSAGLAYVTSAVPTIRDLLFNTRVQAGHAAIGFTGLGLMVAISPLFALCLFGTGPQTRLRSTLLYWSIVSTIGASFGAVLLAYTGASVATTFAAAAAGFGALSLFGYTTKRDLSAGGAFLTTGLVGLVAAILLNLLFRSSALGLAVDTMGVLVFAGLIAYDFQRLKLMFHRSREDAVSLDVATNTGALSLYLDFVNLFQFLLALVGGRR